MKKLKRKGRRRKGILWDYNWDGVFDKERYTASDKKYWRRWKRRQNKQIDL